MPSLLLCTSCHNLAALTSPPFMHYLGWLLRVWVSGRALPGHWACRALKLLLSDTGNGAGGGMARGLELWGLCVVSGLPSPRDLSRLANLGVLSRQLGGSHGNSVFRGECPKRTGCHIASVVVNFCVSLTSSGNVWYLAKHYFCVCVRVSRRDDRLTE